MKRSVSYGPITVTQGHHKEGEYTLWIYGPSGTLREATYDTKQELLAAYHGACRALEAVKILWTL